MKKLTIDQLNKILSDEYNDPVTLREIVNDDLAYLIQSLTNRTVSDFAIDVLYSYIPFSHNRPDKPSILIDYKKIEVMFDPNIREIIIKLAELLQEQIVSYLSKRSSEAGEITLNTSEIVDYELATRGSSNLLAEKTTVFGEHIPLTSAQIALLFIVRKADGYYEIDYHTIGYIDSHFSHSDGALLKMSIHEHVTKLNQYR